MSTTMYILMFQGCTTWWQTEWFQFLWPQNLTQQPIATKELLPVVLAWHQWGRFWRGQPWCTVIVKLCCLVNSGYSKDSSLMQLLCWLFFTKASFEISSTCVFCSGHQNKLSSNNNSRVSSEAPGVAAARLVVTQLIPVVQKLFVAGLATSTKRVYVTSYKRYVIFCDCTQLAPFPASESTLQLFSTKRVYYLAQLRVIWLQQDFSRIWVT